MLIACGSGEHAAPAQAPPAPAASAAPAEKAPSAAERALAERLAHGKELYTRICAVCHGASGEGYKADQAPAIGRTEFLAAVTDNFLRTAIANGRSGSTMSSWSNKHGGPLSNDDIDALIALLRSWQRGPAVALDQSPLRGDADAGANIYAAQCTRCHGTDGMSVQAVRIGHHDWLESASVGLIRHAVREGRPQTPMPAFADKLGAQGVEDVVAYVRKLGERPKPPPLPPPPVQPRPLPLGKVPLHPHGPAPKGFKHHPETTPADVIHAQLKRGARMVLLDARPPTDYSNEHIAGAVSVPYYDPAPYLDDLPKNAWLVSYCACPHAESRELAQKLVDAGFEKVTVLNEGLGYWRNKGYKTQTGATQGKP